jgi:hypothetical protein
MVAKTSAIISLFEAKCLLFGPRLMKEFRLTDFQAAGVFGNLGHESGGFRLLQEIKPAVKGSRGGYGWAQWTGPRRRAFEAWCKAEKFDPKTDEANFGYLCVELRGAEAAAIAALRKAKDLSHATDAFCRAFERPGIVNLPSRMVWAKKALPAIQEGVAAPQADAASLTAVEAKAAPAPAPAPAKPTSDKHAVAPKRAAPVKKRAAAVHHIVKHAPKR